MPFSVTESTFLFFISAVMSSVVITNAYYQKQQFYPSVVYITKSSASMGIIYLQGLILVVLVGKLISKVFFGQLRTAEIEHLIERSWYAVTETCLAFTVFRDDLSPKFVALFTLLLFLKCFHWLAEDRVDYMERSPNISLFFHIRVTSLLTILGILDLTFVHLAYQSTLTKGASVQLVFGFEYAILFAVILNISMKYLLHFCDAQTDNPWEDKAIYLLYTELIMGFLKISLYFIFIFIMMKIHTFPLFAIRPMYLAIRGFKKAFNDVIMSRRAIRNMNAFYPDATTQDIENSDNVCIICRENMLGNGTCKKLPCNHIFHTSCLRSWFQRQQTCPTCRMDILRANAAAASSVNNNNANNNNNNNNNNNAANNANRNTLNNNNQNQNNNIPNNNNNNNNNNMANGQMPMNPFLATNPLLLQQFNQLLFRHQQNNNNAAGNVSGSARAAGSSTGPSNNQNSSDESRAGNSGGENNASSSAAASSSSRTSPAAFSQPNLNLNLPNLNTATGGGGVGGGPPIASTIFPFLQSPPFAMPQIPVETLLQGFSDEELSYLEGQTRQQLEARIKCLMDVKTLVTAATIRLQQFNCVVLNCKNNNSVGTQTIDASPNNVNETGDHIDDDLQPTTTTSSTDMSDFPSSTRNVDNRQEHIRQLRLQRFGENSNVPDRSDEWPKQQQNGQSTSSSPPSSSSK